MEVRDFSGMPVDRRTKEERLRDKEVADKAAAERQASYARGIDWTQTTFDAAHKGEYAQQIHGHTWHVRIEWPCEPPKDARFMHGRLRQYLEAAFDHRLLDDVIDDPTNYGVAKAIAQLMGDDIKAIEVWREGACPCGARIEM